ncbi:tRNA-splicing endonuclease subunit Sen54 [Xyrichtys novacula]|nr:tRNA-splicing endonuclease subunit Sen54 [Xyrichtys novacula]
MSALRWTCNLSRMWTEWTPWDRPQLPRGRKWIDKGPRGAGLMSCVTVTNMAEHNMTQSGEKFYNEILSPSELFAAQSRSHKLPVRGQKDFYPNDSEEQRQRLEQSLEEHWSLISEERVERLGNLVKATWIPSEKIVELQTPAGKFWQTMGFSARGKQYLHPEEALHLMECGSVQVFYQDLPLSIQDGYERFLSSSTVSLLQYQVFAHLKRLGYVVHRFDPSSEPSSYARQLNLPQSCNKERRQLKRKRSASPTPSTKSTSQAETQKESTADIMEEEKCSHEEDESKKLPDSDLKTCSETSDTQTGPADSGGGRTWWMADISGDQSEHQPASGSPRWHFSSISFPDLGSSERHPSCLFPPDPSLLPGSLAVGVCDITPWRSRINLRQVKMSAKEQKREMDRGRRRWDINRDKEVRRCRNWAEYHKLQARREGRRKGQPEHLWNREVTPLHDPSQPIPTAELLETISVSKSSNLLEGASRVKASDQWRIRFNVYQPDTVADFKKTNPGRPYCRMCVCSFSDPVPDLRAIKQMAVQSGDIQVICAVVDYGDISFYAFKDFQLPTDVYP